MQDEKRIQNEILLKCTDKDTRLWPNYAGRGWVGKFTRIDSGVLISHARCIDFGLGGTGGSDIIGFKTVKITKDMVGKRFARFVALEVKTEKGKLRPEQEQFLKFIEEQGGLAGLVRDIKMAKGILEENN